jgi:carboxymethylenebutenolidase
VTATKLDVHAADGMMDVYLHRPSGPEIRGPAPTVIFFFDAGGVRASMHEMAERLASHGYLVALPNLFYRAGAFAPFDVKTVFGDPAERARLEGIVKQASVTATMRDTEALLDALASQPGASAAPVGCVGYCLGGRLAFAAAGALPDRVAAVASIHGGNIAVDDPESPHHQAGKIRGQLYFGVADNDQSCTPESQAKLKAALDEAKVRYQLEVYEGAGHGFAVRDLPTYQEAAAERHWERVLALFAEALPRA